MSILPIGCRSDTLLTAHFGALDPSETFALAPKELRRARQTASLTVQRSVLEFPFKIEANLLQRHAGVTIRKSAQTRDRCPPKLDR